jgi:hypothetical protein
LSREVTFFPEKSKTGAVLTIVWPPETPEESIAQQEEERQQDKVHKIIKTRYGDVKPDSSNSVEEHFGPGKQGEKLNSKSIKGQLIMGKANMMLQQITLMAREREKVIETDPG